MRRTIQIVAALALTAGSAPSAAQEPPGLRGGETLLEVEAEGVARAVPDVATFTVAVTTDGLAPPAALSANAERTTRLVQAARGAGIPDADLRTEELNVAPRYRERDGERTDEIIGYRATSRLRVRVSTVARASATLAALVAAGATEVDGPTFTFADPARQTRDARRQAMVEARAQAADYAAALGKRIARVLRVSERRRQSGEGAEIVVTGYRNKAPSLVPIVPGEQDTRVTVWVDYALAD